MYVCCSRTILVTECPSEGCARGKKPHVQRSSSTTLAIPIQLHCIISKSSQSRPATACLLLRLFNGEDYNWLSEWVLEDEFAVSLLTILHL